MNFTSWVVRDLGKQTARWVWEHGKIEPDPLQAWDLGIPPNRWVLAVMQRLEIMSIFSAHGVVAFQDELMRLALGLIADHYMAHGLQFSDLK